MRLHAASLLLALCGAIVCGAVPLRSACAGDVAGPLTTSPDRRTLDASSPGTGGPTMSEMRIALYIGNELYPGNGADPGATITTLQASPLTSPILGLLNQNAGDASQLVYNDGGNPVFDTSGAYIGDPTWPGVIASLRSGGQIREVYLSFSTNGTEYMANLIASDPTAAASILSHIRDTLGFDGIDLDYEGWSFGAGSPPYVLAAAAVQAGLKVTAAPYTLQSEWQAWVTFVQAQGGTVAWLNLQCYAGGKGNNPGDWLGMGSPAVPIVAGTCNDCCCPQTDCTPADMQALYTLWRTGQGSVGGGCWTGTANTAPQAIGGGFIWVYSSIAGPDFDTYMTAVAAGLGM